MQPKNLLVPSEAQFSANRSHAGPPDEYPPYATGRAAACRHRLRPSRPHRQTGINEAPKGGEFGYALCTVSGFSGQGLRARKGAGRREETSLPRLLFLPDVQRRQVPVLSGEEIERRNTSAMCLRKGRMRRPGISPSIHFHTLSSTRRVAFSSEAFCYSLVGSPESRGGVLQKKPIKRRYDQRMRDFSFLNRTAEFMHRL